MGKTSCKKGQYYCNTDKKCKPIPDGYEVRKDGFLVKEGWSDKYKKSIDCDNPKGFSQKAHCAGKKKKMNEAKDKQLTKIVKQLRKSVKSHAKQADYIEKINEGSNPRIPRKKGQPAKSKKHSDLYTDEDPKGTIHGLGFKNVATAKASVAKIRKSSRSHAHKIQAAIAMEQRARVMGKTAEAAVYRKFINSMKKKTKAMNEEKKGDHEYEMIRRQTDNIIVAAKKIKKEVGKGEGDVKAWVQSKITKAADYIDTAADYMTDKEEVKEGSLHKWFKGSKSKDGKGGWVNVVTGGTCASDEPGEGTPKCVSSAKRASMTKKERLSAARRKKRADPNQQKKTGAAKPTYVSTDKPKKKKKMKEEFVSLPLQLEVPQNDGEFKLGLMFRESLEKNRGMLFIFETTDRHSFHMKNTFIPLDIAFINEEGVIESIKELNPMSSIPVYPDGKIRYAVEVNRGWFAENGVVVGDTILEEGCETCGESCDGCECECHDTITEVKDRKGKGSGTKDACYHKVKSRYSVWPSAYASGALVKCRKVGAANWGNSRKEEYVPEGAPDPKTVKVPFLGVSGQGKSGHTRDDKQKAYTTPAGKPKNIKSHYNWRDEMVEHHKKDAEGNIMPHYDGTDYDKGFTDKQLGIRNAEDDIALKTKTEHYDWRETLDEKCWKGYEKKGMKTMFGKRYPNCVKKSKGKTRKEEIDYDEVIEGAAEVLRQTATGGKQKESPNYDYAALRRFYASSTGAGSVYEGNRVRKSGYTILGSGNKKDMSKGPNEATPVDYTKLVMGNKKKKINKPVKNLKDFDSPEYLKNNQLMPGSGIDKKFGGKNTDLAHYELEGELVEKKMTKKDIEKRDEIADSMPKKDFKDRYGDDAESVMYGAATNIVKKQKKKKKKKVLSASYNMDKDVTESGLIIQDWNKDDIKFTEIETVDVIKPKKLNETLDRRGQGAGYKMTDSEFREMEALQSRDFGTGNKLIKNKEQRQKLTNKYMLELSRRSKDAGPGQFTVDRGGKGRIPVTVDSIQANFPKLGVRPSLIKKEHYDWRSDLDEDWQKINRKDKTDGMSKAAVKAYRRENPGSKLKTAVTKDPKKLKKGSKSAKRRLAFCRRMKGMKKKLTSAKTSRDPDSRINKALRRWNC